jgi:hypothetical protein
VSDEILAIGAVVNPLTPEIVASRPDRSGDVHGGTFRQEQRVRAGCTKEQMPAMLDEAGIGRACLVAAEIGQPGLQGSSHPDPRIVADRVRRRPARFGGLVGLDPAQGVASVRALRRRVREYGVIGALDAPVPIPVGQSLFHDPRRPLRPVGEPITLDAVACDCPVLHCRRMREEVASPGLRPGPLRGFPRDNARRVCRLD